jgi:hypothetical protein
MNARKKIKNADWALKYLLKVLLPSIHTTVRLCPIRPIPFPPSLPITRKERKKKQEKKLFVHPREFYRPLTLLFFFLLLFQRYVIPHHLNLLHKNHKSQPSTQSSSSLPPVPITSHHSCPSHVSPNPQPTAPQRDGSGPSVAFPGKLRFAGVVGLV